MAAIKVEWVFFYWTKPGRPLRRAHGSFILLQETFRYNPRVSYSGHYKMWKALQKKVPWEEKREWIWERHVCIWVCVCMYVWEGECVMKAVRSMTCISLSCNLNNAVHLIGLVKWNAIAICSILILCCCIQPELLFVSNKNNTGKTETKLPDPSTTKQIWTGDGVPDFVNLLYLSHSCSVNCS